jgi:hypothetical protein
MKLKEKFKQWLDTEPRIQIREVPLEDIADKFAIGFAEWLNKDKETKNRLKELLEIYKKEKGL